MRQVLFFVLIGCRVFFFDDLIFYFQVFKYSFVSSFLSSFLSYWYLGINIYFLLLQLGETVGNHVILVCGVLLWCNCLPYRDVKRHSQCRTCIIVSCINWGLIGVLFPLQAWLKSVEARVQIYVGCDMNFIYNLCFLIILA